jgi:hypothetical protein
MIPLLLVSIVAWAVLVSTTAAAFLAIVRSWAPGRKGYWGRLSYCFWNYSLPAWCGLELVQWLVFHRWVPWALLW